MYTELYSNLVPHLSAADSPAITSMTAFNAAHINTCDHLGRLHWELMTLHVDTGIEQFKLLTDPASSQDFFVAETDLMQQYQSKASRIGQAWLQTVTTGYQDILPGPAEASPATAPATPAAVDQPVKKTRKKTAKSRAARRPA